MGTAMSSNGMSQQSILQEGKGEMSHFTGNTGWKVACKEDLLERGAFELQKAIGVPKQREQPPPRWDRAGFSGWQVTVTGEQHWESG